MMNLKISTKAKAIAESKFAVLQKSLKNGLKEYKRKENEQRCWT